jgi:opacity protein-like surface antigen
MKGLIVAVLCLLVTSNALAADSGYKVMYDGGSVQGLKTGSKSELFIDQSQIRLTQEGKDIVAIPASAVTEISYGQDVHRRVGAAIGLAIVSFGVGALMALTKSKKHFVGLTWTNGDQKGGFAMQCDKNDYRGVLAGLEGVTGKKAVDSDAMTVKN